MRLGVIIPGGGMTIPEIVQVGRDAEAVGLDGVWVTEAWRSAFVPLTAIAAATSRIAVGTYVINAYGRTPFITAMSAVDLDEASGGRLVLGIGSGNRFTNLLYQGVPTERPLVKLREYVELVKRFVRARPGDVVDYEGTIHSMTGCPPQVVPVRRDIPVYLAATFPGMRKVAGAVADGVALGALHSVDYVENVVKPAVAAAAEAAGRDPATIVYAMPAFTSFGDDRAAARDAARRAICNLYAPKPHPHYDFLLREQGFATVADAVEREVHAGRPAAARRQVPDELLDALTAAGTRDECVRRLDDYRGVVDELILMNVAAMKYREEESAPSDPTVVGAFRRLVELGAGLAGAAGTAAPTI